MLDEMWIKTLATAELEQGAWKTTNPQEVQRRLATSIKNTITELYNEAKESCVLFNQYAKKGKILRVLPMTDEKQDSLEGFILLLGAVQLKLMFDDYKLVGKVVALSGFAAQSRICVVFHACFDALGSLYWKTDNGVLMDHELIVKTLFESIVREASANQ